MGETLAVALADDLGGSLGEDVELLGGAFAFVRALFESLRQLAVDPGEIGPVRLGGSASLFHRPGAEVVGIVWHQRETSAGRVGSLFLR